MKKQTILLASTLVFYAFSYSVYASDTGFKGSGEFGFTNTTGNTESTSVIGALKLNYIQPIYEIKTAFSVNNKSENDIQTQQRYVADLQYDRFYSEDKDYYSFSQVRFESDDFADLNLDALFTVGLGKTLFKNENSNFSLEAGLGYQSLDYIVAKDVDQTIARLKADYFYQINNQVAFTQDAIVYAGPNQTKLETNTAVKVNMAASLSIKAGFQYRTNSDPAEGFKKDDTQTTLAVIYDF